MAIADLTALKTKLARGGDQRFRRYKAGTTGLGTNPWSSLWRQVPDQGSSPTTADNALGPTTVGALFPAVSVSGAARLIQIEGMASFNGMVMLCDRLAHQGGLSGAVTGAQTTNLPVGPGARYTSGDQVWAALEVYTQIGATGTTFTAGYTNQAGTAGRTTPVRPIGGNGFREPGTMYMLALQEGDTGVRSVENVTLAATTGTAGNFGVTLFKPLVFLPVIKGQTFLWDVTRNGCGNIPDLTGACPFLLYFYSGANLSNEFMAEYRFADA